MGSFIVEGRNSLEGIVDIGGSKNAALPILASTVITGRENILENIPDIEDVKDMLDILSIMGCSVQFENGIALIDTRGLNTHIVPEKLVRKIRSSIILMGAVLQRTGQVEVAYPGVIGTYRKISEKYTWVGWLGWLSGFFILAFYSVLGGFTVRYFFGFLLELFSNGTGFGGMDSGAFFGSFILSAPMSILFHAIFMATTIIIVMGGISGGIEKFAAVAMPTLFVMVIIVVIRSITLEGSFVGLEFMFKPDIEAMKEIGLMRVLKTAAGQMFFSLSLGMGCMITYGSYLSKSENLEKNAMIIPIADTCFATLSALAVLPAVGAFIYQGVEGVSFGAGPGLLFVTLHRVFSVGMGGFMGNFFGAFFDY
jgi:SNF family Na+-dependent transporter